MAALSDLSRLSPAALADLLDEIVRGLAAHWGQEVFADTNRAYWQDSPRHRAFLRAVRGLRGAPGGHAALVTLAAQGLVGRWFAAGPAPLYAVSLSRNNDVAFAALTAQLDAVSGPRLGTNASRRAPLWRMAALLSRGGLASAARSLDCHGHPNACVLAYQVFGAACGLLFLRDLQRARPRLIGTANDHSPPTYALLAAGRTCGIPRFYVQHAPVTPHFPPLDVDLAILEDTYAAEAYRRAAERTGQPWDGRRCHILGRVPPPPAPVRACRPPLSICIGLSMYPDPAGLESLVAALRRPGTVGRIALRPHPRYPHPPERLASPLGLEVEPAGGDLDALAARTDLFVVSNSGLAVDLLRRAAPTAFHDALDQQWRDYFGLVASGLLPEPSPAKMADPDALSRLFSPGWRDLARAAFAPGRATDDRVLAVWMTTHLAPPGPQEAP